MEYYKATTGKPLPNRIRNWGVYLDGISKTPNHDERAVALLRHIKDSYRNPVSHPEEVLSVDVATVLFGVCVGAIAQMAPSLPDRNP